MRYFLPFATLVLFVVFTNVDMHAQELCGSGILHERLMQTDKAYQQATVNANAEWLSYNSRAQAKTIVNGVDTVYELPVVVHIIHTGEPLGSMSNPTDKEVADYINYTNSLLAATHSSVPDTNNGGVRIPVRLVLAKVSPDCNSTNGIVRVNGSSISSYVANGIDVSGGNSSDVKALSRWSNEQYVNIWIVKGTNPALGGYANYPWSVQDATDGIVLSASSSIYQSSTTLAHEVGHFLGLYHSFEGDNNGNNCPPVTNCLTTGDKICDTEPHKRYPDCFATINPCTGMSYNNMQQNYMSYGCTRNRFTIGQRDKILHDIKYYRQGLLLSRKGEPSLSTVVKTPSCIPTSTSTFGANGPKRVTFNDIDNITNVYYTDNYRPYVDYSCVYRTEVDAGKLYELAVSGVSTQHIAVYIDYNNDGSFDMNSEAVFVAPKPGSKNITIPTTAVTDVPLRMRVIGATSQNQQLAPCVDIGNGQAEDYGVIIHPAVGISTYNNIMAAIDLYPNPVNNSLHVAMSADVSFSMKILNAGGGVVYSGIGRAGKLTVDVAALPAGIYIVRIITDDAVVNRSFSKL